MTNRLEPTLSGKVALDDTNNPAHARAQSHNRSARPAPAPVSQRIVEVKSPLAPLALVAAIIALGMAGVIFWQFSLERESLHTKLQAADARIAELEQKLTVTGDESMQSVTTLSAGLKSLDASLKESETEIRKLWGVTNDRNRKAIDENKQAIASLQKVIADSQKLDENNKKTVASLQALADGLQNAQQKDQKTLQAKLADMQGELAVLKEVQESQQAAFGQSRNLAAELQALKTNTNSRIAANEEAVKSFDAFRLQVNRRLLQMGGAPAQ